jgi:mono/diheme cytochrome c family protein
MGSHTQAFILGFTPLQINRRPKGTSGTIEDTADDELSQLQRLIDYKVITGIDSLNDVLPLEASEGDRAPRNDYELTAQAYMTGNCSHCHNPRGYPTVQNPVLRDVLNFYPDKPGGIFQFPLERTSPRIKRGPLQDIRIPYITPSLFDLEPDNSKWGEATYKPKYIVIKEAEGNWLYNMAAPWRSLIYRNVDSPYAYVEDYALYPHMPMDTPGFDPRVPKIVADWMISIPSRLRSPSARADNAAVPPDSPGQPASGLVAEQPYVEVKPGEDGYAQAVTDAKQRLNFYHKGGRDTAPSSDSEFQTVSVVGLTHVNYRYALYGADTSDIVDPAVGSGLLIPDDGDPSPSFLPSLPTPLNPNPQDPLDMFTLGSDGVPNRAHWVVTDVTDAPGPWNPRRIDWQDVLVNKQVTGLDDRQQRVVSLLQSLVITDDFKRFATTPQPFGLWQRKPTCDFAGAPKASDFTDSQRPQWLDYRAQNIKTAQLGPYNIPKLKDDDPVYLQSPGASVFGEICINCHGPKYDSRGRQADNILLMTGGDTRVANLRDGLLGPVDQPGANRMRVFSAGPAPATYDDWAARYVAWMGLGGTQRQIPVPILSIIGTAQVFGEPRPNAIPTPDGLSANMLSIAQQLCKEVLGESANKPNVKAFMDPNIGAIIHANGGEAGTALIEQTGDAETWLQVCSYMNTPPVRVILPPTNYTGLFSIQDWRPALGYSTKSLVGDHRGALATGVARTNLFPWCMVPPATPEQQAAADKYVSESRAGKALPFCPADWLATAPEWMDADRERWSVRGAINAGVSVFLYLKQRSEDAANGKLPPPSYDQCELIKH